MNGNLELRDSDLETITAGKETISTSLKGGDGGNVLVGANKGPIPGLKSATGGNGGNVKIGPGSLFVGGGKGAQVKF
jgi:hypothetical protein